MKLSELIKTINFWKGYYDKRNEDPDVVIQIDQKKIAKSYKKGKLLDELDLINDSCDRSSTERNNAYLVLFTCREN